MGAGLLPILLLVGVGGALAAASRKGAAAGPTKSGTYTLDQNLPPQLEQQVLGALSATTDPNQLLFLGSQMDAMGYHLTAAALRQRASQLQTPVAPEVPVSPVMGPPTPGPAPAVAPPPPSGPLASPIPAIPIPAPIPVPTVTPATPDISGLDVGMDPQTRAAVMQALATESDPAKLSGFAAAIQLKYPLAAGLLLAKAAAMQATQPLGPTIPTPAPSPPPPGAPVPLPPAPPAAAIDPSQLAPGHSVRALMNADQWYGVLTLLNGWLEDNHADPAISFVDLGFFRDNVDDLQDQGNFQLAVDALQSHANQKGYSLPPNLPGSEAGVMDGQTFATLLSYSAQHGHPIPVALVPTAAAIQSALAGLSLGVIGAPGAPMAAPVAAPMWPAPTALPAAIPALALPVAPITTLRDVQHALNVLGGQGTPLAEDGVNGSKTIAAVKAFQTSHGLTVDGIAGPQTKAALQAAMAAGSPPFAMPSNAVSAVVDAARAPVRPPAPAAVPALASLRDVQHALNVLAGPGTPLTEDGINGPKTIAAVKAFQSAHGLTADGIAGPQTKSALQAAIAAAAPHPATQASLGLSPVAAVAPPPALGLVRVKAPAPAAAAAPSLLAPPAAATTTTTTGTWKLATNADVTRDGVANRFAALLAQPVGTETLPEVHNSRTWKFRVISKQTDPALTSFTKDVKGYVLQPLAATGS